MPHSPNLKFITLYFPSNMGEKDFNFGHFVKINNDFTKTPRGHPLDDWT